MKNIIEKIIILLFILITFNNYAEGLFVIKKNKFTSCEEMFQHDSYKGNGEYILYDENQNPYKKYCKIGNVVFKQENFGSLAASVLKDISEIPHNKIKIYHSDDLYYIFEQKIINNRNSLDTLEAIEVVNTNNVAVGRYILILSSEKTSGIITSDSLSGWCSPTNGRYNGVCYNGSRGIGEWEIMIL